MLQIRIGARVADLGQPLKKALLTAARLGAQAVEIDARHEVRPRDFTGTALRQLRNMLDDLNLRVSAVAFPTRRGYEVADDLEARVDATKQAMRLAYDLGAGVVVNHVGAITPPGDDAQPLLEQALTDLGRYGQHVGAVLAARTGAEPASELLGLIQRLPIGALAVDFDPGRLIVHGFSASDAIGLLAEHVRHVHVTDGARDFGRGQGVETPIGRGVADYPAILGKLEEVGYRGWFTIDRSGARQPLDEIAQAIEYLRNLD